MDSAHSSDSELEDSDIAHQEELDIIDPLRHLRRDHSAIQSKSHDAFEGGETGTIQLQAGTQSVLIPSQPPSVHNQIITLSYPVSDTDTDSDTDAQNLHPPLFVRLEVDAGPGCGGVAWPAGEVSTSTLFEI